MRARNFLVICLANCLAAAAVLAAGSAAAQPLAAGRAPDFETLRSDGTPWKLAGQRGRLVLLNFFAESCVHCKEEIPVLNGLAKEYAGSLVIAGIAKDAAKPAAAAKLGKLFGCTYAVLTDGTDSKLSDAFHVYGLPHSVLVDETGSVEGVYRGIFPETLDELKQKIRAGRDRIAALRAAFDSGHSPVAVGAFEPKNELAARKTAGTAAEDALKHAFEAAADAPLVVRGTVASSERGSFVEYRIEDRRGRLWSGPETVKIRGEDFLPLVAAVTEKLQETGKQLK